jgi:hypothetical protein
MPGAGCPRRLSRPRLPRRPQSRRSLRGRTPRSGRGTARIRRGRLGNPSPCTGNWRPPRSHHVVPRGKGMPGRVRVAWVSPRSTTGSPVRPTRRRPLPWRRRESRSPRATPGRCRARSRRVQSRVSCRRLGHGQDWSRPRLSRSPFLGSRCQWSCVSPRRAGWSRRQWRLARAEGPPASRTPRYGSAFWKCGSRRRRVSRHRPCGRPRPPARRRRRRRHRRHRWHGDSGASA